MAGGDIDGTELEGWPCAMLRFPVFAFFDANRVRKGAIRSRVCMCSGDGLSDLLGVDSNYGTPQNPNQGLYVYI